LKNAVESENGVFTIWLTRNFTTAEALQAVVESRCTGFIAEAEIPSENEIGEPKPEAQNWPELIFALKDQNIFKAVVTNFAPFVHGRTDVPQDDPRYSGKPWPEKARPLVEAGWHCLTEAYDLTGEPALWPDRRHAFAQHLGWTQTQPVLGTYGGRTLADFPSRNFYPNWSCWDAGSIL
jgi:hypothetical protein